MKFDEEFDNFEDFENEETKHKLPLGWLTLYIGLIVWGIYYLYMYTPMFTGWTQAGEFMEIMKTVK